MNIDIHPLRHFEAEPFMALASGYTTAEVYHVTREEDETRTTIALSLEPLPEVKAFTYPFSEDDINHYRNLVPGDYCFGAYDGEQQVGVALAEPQQWNQVLWVWDFHVAQSYRGRGIGRRLMDALIAPARREGLRAIVCETQNTNVPAIRFYRAVGFTVEGIDISYYTNGDMLPGGTVAVFMKLRLE